MMMMMMADLPVRARPGIASKITTEAENQLYRRWRGFCDGSGRLVGAGVKGDGLSELSESSQISNQKFA